MHHVNIHSSVNSYVDWSEHGTLLKPPNRVVFLSKNIVFGAIKQYVEKFSS